MLLLQMEHSFKKLLNDSNHVFQLEKWMNYHTVTHPLVSPNLHFHQYLCWTVSPLWIGPEIALLLFSLPEIFFFFWKCLHQISFKALCLCMCDFDRFASDHNDPLFLLLSASCVAADIISTVEFNSTGELLATGDKGGRVVVFQREQEVWNANSLPPVSFFNWDQKRLLWIDCFWIGLKLHYFWH